MKNEIENIFKQKFENYESTPSAGLFEKIQAARAKKKRRALWWSSAAILLLAVGIGYATLSEKGEKPLAVDTTVENGEQKTTLGTEQVTQKATTDRENPVNQTTNEEQKRSLYTQKTIAANAKNANGSTYYPTLGKSKSTIVQKEDSLIDKKDNRTVNAELAKLFAQIQEANKNADPKKAKVFTRNGESEIEISNINLDNLKKRNIPQTNTTTPAVDTANASLLAKIAADEKTLADNPLPIHKLVKLSRWSVEASAAGGLGSRILAGPNTFVSSRNDAESAKFSMAYNINLQYRIDPKWSIQSGVAVVDRKENLTYTTADQKTYTQREEVRTETIIHPVLGEIEREYTVYITDSFLQKGTEVKQTNRFLTASIPIVLERSLYEKNKWSLMTKVGLLAGIYSNNTGQIFTTEGTTEELQKAPFKTAGFHAITCGIGTAYKCNDRISVIAYPQAFMGLNSIMNKNAIISQKELGFYTHLGLRVQL